MAVLCGLAVGGSRRRAVPASSPAAERGSGFELHASSVSPKRPLLDGRRKITLRYGYGARRPVELEIRVVRAASGNVVRAWTERGARPGRRLEREWNGLNRRGDAVPDGRYVFEVGPRGGRLRGAGRFRLHGHVFPVDGPHSTRGAIGEFGAAAQRRAQPRGLRRHRRLRHAAGRARGAARPRRRATTTSSTATTCGSTATKTGEEYFSRT